MTQFAYSFLQIFGFPFLKRLFGYPMRWKKPDKTIGPVK